jgi:hypothetical protein
MQQGRSRLRTGISGIAETSSLGMDTPSGALSSWTILRRSGQSSARQQVGRAQAVSRPMIGATQSKIRSTGSFRCLELTKTCLAKRGDCEIVLGGSCRVNTKVAWRAALPKKVGSIYYRGEASTPRDEEDVS